jgi:ribosomal protein S18 acetylase RimI-like enzyme
MYDIRPMTIHDYPEVFALWTGTEGLSISDDDAHDRIALYLSRNPGLSFVALIDGDVVGTVLCGHDGRRGILRHLAVVERHRGLGIARALALRAIEALAHEGIQRCNLYVLDSNPAAQRFWEHLGWYQLEDTYRTLQVQIPDQGKAVTVTEVSS